MAVTDFTPIGAVFSRLTVVGAPFRSGTQNSWVVLCRCECGNERNVGCWCLVRGQTSSCGCFRREKMLQSRRPLDLPQVGSRYSRLVVLSAPFKAGSRGRWQVTCKCECGKSKDVDCRLLSSGNTKSCGCLKRKHGHHDDGKASPTYKSWLAAKSRCFDRGNGNYPQYGGCGITMCNRWSESFEDFLADMGERPAGMTLDRFPEKNGNYEPGNCRWATCIEQSNNRRDNQLLMHAGELKTAPQIARDVGINCRTLRSRLRAGWPLERAISSPVRVHN